MKIAVVLEFSDLTPEKKEEVIQRVTNEMVCAELDILFESVRAGEISEDEAYETIGCSKEYASSTPWFVPSVYYENNKEKVDKAVNGFINSRVFDKNGEAIAVDLNDDSIVDIWESLCTVVSNLDPAVYHDKGMRETIKKDLENVLRILNKEFNIPEVPDGN